VQPPVCGELPPPDGDPIGSASLAPSSGGAKATLQISTLAAGQPHESWPPYAGEQTNYNASTSNPKSHTVIPGAAVVGTQRGSRPRRRTRRPYGPGWSPTTRARHRGTTPRPLGCGASFSVDGQRNVGDPVEVVGGRGAEPERWQPPGARVTTRFIAGFIGNPRFSPTAADFLAQNRDGCGRSPWVSPRPNASSSYGQASRGRSRRSSSTPAAGIGNPGRGTCSSGSTVCRPGPGRGWRWDADGKASSPTVSTPDAGRPHTVPRRCTSGSAHFRLGRTPRPTQKRGARSRRAPCWWPARARSPSGRRPSLTAPRVTPRARPALGAPTGNG